MNWCHNSFLGVQRWASDERSDLCEHVEADRKAAKAVLCEDDSFGPVGRYVVCMDCYYKAQEEEEQEIVQCDDCKSLKAKAVCREWKWYDFYSQQGDEALNICDDCRELPKHQNRVVKDDRDRKHEEEYWEHMDERSEC